jgi:hypothetical protein
LNLAEALSKSPAAAEP